MRATTPIIRKATVGELNAIVNDPAVIEHLGGVLGQLYDIQSVDHWEQMIPLTTADGGGAILFLPVEAGIYRIDLLFRPGDPHNLADARAILTHVFDRWNASGVFGFIATENVRAQRFVDKLPAVEVNRTEDEITYAIRRSAWPWFDKPGTNT